MSNLTGQSCSVIALAGDRMKIPTTHHHLFRYLYDNRFKQFWQTVQGGLNPDNRFTWVVLAGSLVLLKVVNLYFQQIHVDIAWNLYIAGQILDGARLHVDLVETNTPLRHYLGIPPVWLARILGWPVLLTFYGYILLLAGLSLALCRHILNKMFISMPVWWHRTLLLVLVYVYTIYVSEQFGQKEHLMLILAMPHLFAVAGRAIGQSFKGWAAFFIGGLAGIGLSIKPFFLLLWLLGEAYLFLTLRRQYPYRRPENIGLSLVVFGYTTFLLLDGAYLALVPLLQQTYAQIKIDFSDLLYNQVYTSFSAVQLIVAALIVMMIVPLTAKEDKALANVVLISAVGVLAIAFYQQKGWPNHFYPAGAVAIFLLGLLTLRLIFLIKKVLSQKIVFAFMTLFLLQGVHPLVVNADHILATLEAGQPLATVSMDPPIARLVDLINAHTDKGDYIVQLPGFYPIPQVINYTQTRSSLRYAHPWLLEAAYWEQRDKFFADRSVEPFPYHSAEEMDATEREFVNNVMADLLAHRPKLILVNASWSFDAIEYFSRDARFVEFWSNYILLDQVVYGSPPFGRVVLTQVYQYLSPADYVPVFQQKLRLVNPTDKPYVYVYIWNNDQTETYLLDDSSRWNKAYEIEWMISPNKIEFEGPHKRHDSSITALSPDHPLAIAVAFSHSPERKTQNIFERRFRFKLTDDGRMGVLLPPEEWHNPNWPDESGWQITDIDQVMADR
jgi:hypothetical protein